MKYLFILALAFLNCMSGVAQEVPSKEENIPFLVTFGSNADKSYGDDDYVQTFFFVIPENYNEPFYIKVFDPDVGGLNDEMVGEFNTKTKFTVYGGKGCISNSKACGTNPTSGYDSGALLVPSDLPFLKRTSSICASMMMPAFSRWRAACCGWVSRHWPDRSRTIRWNRS